MRKIISECKKNDVGFDCQRFGERILNMYNFYNF